MKIPFFSRRGPLGILENRIGHRFRDLSLLETALTHRSFRFERKAIDEDNQRLEFLGDAVLGMLTAEAVYERHGDDDEGVLTVMRSHIANGRALSEMAREIGLGDFMRVGRGEELAGGRERDSLLADALEALLGAVYLDGGLIAARRMFVRVCAKRLQAPKNEIQAGNPKGRLLELAQRRFNRQPAYKVVEENGQGHAREFEVEARVGNDWKARGRGVNKRRAEAEAARRLLEVLDGGS